MDETVKEPHAGRIDEHKAATVSRRTLLGGMAALGAGLAGALAGPGRMHALAPPAPDSEAETPPCLPSKVIAGICDHYSAGDPEAFALSKQMATTWVSFARSGHPNHSGLPHWPAYAADGRATMVFNAPCAVRHDPEGEGRREKD